MPPVIAWVAAAVVSATGISIAAATWVSTLLVNGAIMFGAQKLLGKKANTGDFMGEVAERTQMVRQSTAPRRLIYGRCKLSGIMVYAKETGTKREYLHMAVVLASHQSDAILDLLINDELVPFDGNEPIVGSRYRGFVRINKHLGTIAQTADADLVAECGPEWTTDHRLIGHTYLAVRVKYDETVFPSGLPQIAAVVRGVLVLDPRDGITRWTSNSALCVFHFMQSAYGLGIPYAEFDIDSVIAAANICDEDVGLATTFTRNCELVSGVRHIYLTTQSAAQLDGIQPGMLVAGAGIPTGAIVVSINTNPDDPAFFFTIDRDPVATGSARTLTFGDSEKRYSCNGTVDTSGKAGDTIEAMLSSMAGKAVYAGGKWFIHAGAYQTPTESLSEDDCRGPIQVTTKLPRRELANLVKGVFVSEADGWVATDFPQYAPAGYLAEDDNERLPRDIQLPFTTSSSAAQRLAKIELERTRQQILTRWPCKLSALKIQCGDNVMLNNAREGWVDKVFEVVSFILVPYKDDRGNPAIGVDLALRETASGVWDWADGAETVTDLAPNTTLHNPFAVVNPTGLTLLADATTSWIDNDGAHVPRVKVSWTAPADQYVLSGGTIQIQYKKHADAAWIDWTTPPGDQVFEFVSDVQAGVAYDFRIRSVSVRGIPAAAWVDSLGAYPAGYTVSGDLVACDPVTGGSVTSLPESLRLSWSLPDLTVVPNTDLDYVEVYEAGSFTAPIAGTAATFRAGKENTFLRSNVTAGATGYYWARTVDQSRNKSAWAYLGTGTAQNGVSYAVGLANTAQSTANTAVTSANGKNTSFYQGTTPTAIRSGDLWFKTGTDELYEWNGSSWVLLNFKAAMISGTITNTQIADDAISTPKLQANSITSLKVGTNQIVAYAANIADAVITSAKIVSLDAGKITAGNITVALNLTSGSITAGAGSDNEVQIDSNGFRVGRSTGGSFRAKQYSAGYAYAGLFDSTGAVKSSWIYNGDVTFDGGGAVNSRIQNFDKINSQNVKALSSSNPRTSDAPLATSGGGWIGSDLDVRGTLYANNDVYAQGIRYAGFTGNRISFGWNGANVKVYVDGTVQGTIPNP